jgi:hypothetical protein
MENLAALVAANEEAAAAIASAYEVLLGGVPNIAGFEIVINSAIAAGITDFNQENIFINIVNSLVQGNPDAATAFNNLIAGQASLTDKIVAMYKALVPASEQTDAGIAFLTRPDAIKFYQDAVVERGIAGPNGEAIAALSAILNVLYTSDIGIGDDVNDLLAAIANGSAQLPASGDTFTPIEIADGTDFDDDDADLQGGTFNLTTGADFGADFAGTANDDTYNAGVVQTALIPNQTLNSGDNIDGGGGRDKVWAQLVDFLVAPQGLTSIEHLSLENAPIALGLAVGPRVVDAINADAIDEVSFRAPNANVITGLGVTNVSTVVNTVNINDSGSLLGLANHFISFIGDALDGDADEIDINLSNVNNTTLTLNGAYEIANINSGGPVANSFTLAVATAQTVNITGNQDLLLGPMEIDPLALVNASTFQADLSAVFTNTVDAGLDGVNDVLEVRGGIGNDSFTFGVLGDFDSDITASGGDGDDEFVFTRVGGRASFGTDDSVAGGAGVDELWIDVAGGPGNTQELLVDGVGGNITEIERIGHFVTGGSMNDDLTVDWTRKGSATELELAADYSSQNVTVTGLTNDDTVIYSGDDIGNLSLTSLNGGGSLSNEINLIIETTLPGSRVDIQNQLIVDPDTELLNLEVSGLGYVEIDDASNLQSDVAITGSANLSLGFDVAYDEDGGTIDGSAATGDLRIALGAGNQSVAGGSGDDLFIQRSFQDVNSVDVFFLGAGGSDTVLFEDSFTTVAGGTVVLNDFAFQNIRGFSVADDVVAIDQSIFGFELNGSTVNDEEVQQDYVAGTLVALNAGVNFIKFTTAYTGPATGTEDDAFDQAVGLGSIAGTIANADYIVSVYDATNQQVLILEINTDGDTDIDAADEAVLVTTIGMSAADYATFGVANIDFVA